MTGWSLESSKRLLEDWLLVSWLTHTSSLSGDLSTRGLRIGFPSGCLEVPSMTKLVLIYLARTVLSRKLTLVPLQVV